MKKSELRQIIKEEYDKLKNGKVDSSLKTNLADDLENMVDKNKDYKKVIQKDKTIEKKWTEFINSLLNL
jgi:hypothetical protein